MTKNLVLQEKSYLLYLFEQVQKIAHNINQLFSIKLKYKRGGWIRVADVIPGPDQDHHLEVRGREAYFVHELI